MNFKDKKVLVVDCGNFVETAPRLARDFGKVYFWKPNPDAFPTMGKSMIGNGMDGITLINDIFQKDKDYNFDEIDLFVFTDIYFGWIQEHLVSLGKRVWGCRTADDLELYRAEYNALQRRIGMNATDIKVVKGIQKLRDYLKTVNEKYIKISYFRGEMETWKHTNYKLSETQIDELEHNLGPLKNIIEFVVESKLDAIVEAGIDTFNIDGKYPENILLGYELKDIAYCSKHTTFSSLPDKFQEVHTKLSNTFKAYQMRGFFSSEVRVTKDDKWFLIDPCCFSDDSEVLTNDGWKLFKDLDGSEFICTLNTSNNNIEYQKPIDYISYHYDGEMIKLTNDKKTIEKLITPNHEILRYDRYKNKLFKERADSLTDNGFIPRSGIWNGNESIIHFVLPEITKTCYPEVKIPMNTFCEFMGWYLSVGSLKEDNCTIDITQYKFKNELIECIKKLPFEYSVSNNGVHISSIQLYDYLKQFNLCDNKFVPNIIKNTTKENIKSFLKGYKFGDGTMSIDDDICYFTISKKLADDIQELILKTGLVCNIYKQNTKGASVTIDGKPYISNHDLYTIIQNTETDYWFETQFEKDKYIQKEKYNGMVYCVEVPNNTVYVRRNGKPFWSGNCRQGSPPSELYMEMIDNLAEVMWFGAEGKLVEPKYNFEYGLLVNIYSTWSDENWQPIFVPDTIKRFVKFKYCIKQDDRYYIVPQHNHSYQIGSIIAFDDSMEKCIAKIKKYAENIKGPYLDIKLDNLDKCIEAVKQGEQVGIKF